MEVKKCIEEKVSEKLQQARTYEEAHKASADSQRLHFHVTPGIGWMNDPNGFSVYQGEYHLFYQYHPYSTEWGPMHWGHVKSKDLVKWERLPIALAPDQEYDKDGCFSGSAIELPDGKHLLLYTGVEKRQECDTTGNCLVEKEYQTQCAAFGDGVHYEKYANNPVISGKLLPAGASTKDFRDPKIWKEEDAYYAIAGTYLGEDNGAVLLFKSEDCLHWEYVSVLAQSNGTYGTMWECPDFFGLEGKQILLVSPCGMQAEGLEFHSGQGVVAFLGEYDKVTHTFKREKAQAIDYGLDFYAPQTIQAVDGKRILIGWMRNWATTACRREGRKIFGEMTLPRELTIKNDRIYQNPVAAIKEYWVHPVEYRNITVDKETILPDICGRYLDMTVTVSPVDEGYKAFRLRLAADEKYYAEITYTPYNGVVKVDRSHTGPRADMVHERSFCTDSFDGNITLRIIMDGDSVELFINDGERACTFMVFSPENAEKISFAADGGKALLQVEKHDIEL